MTLIISFSTYNRIVQASDRRLTWPDGTVDDDEANKAVCVSCKDACFAVAYTGRAKLGSLRTDEWLVSYLTSIDAAGKELMFIARELDKETKPRSGKLTYALAGYWLGKPFLMRISNWMSSELMLMKPHIRPSQASAILIDGEERAVSQPIHQQLKKLRRQRFVQQNTDDDAAAKLVTLVRAAQHTPKYGYVVGRSCMSVVITPLPDYPHNCNIRAQYHPDQAGPLEYAPHFITYYGTYSHIKIGNDCE